MQGLIVPRLLVLLILPVSEDEWLTHRIEPDRHLVVRNWAFHLNLCDFEEVDQELITIRVPWINHFNETSLSEMMQYVAVNKKLP